MPTEIEKELDSIMGFCRKKYGRQKELSKYLSKRMKKNITCDQVSKWLRKLHMPQSLAFIEMVGWMKKEKVKEADEKVTKQNLQST